MALDHGDKRIGVAVTDPSDSIALGLPTIETDDSEGEVDKIVEIVLQRGVTQIVVGLPRHMDGGEGQRARKARGFVKRLRREMPDVEYVFVDERMTSARAKRALTAEKARANVRKDNVDKMAAQFILKRFLTRDNVEPDEQTGRNV